MAYNTEFQHTDHIKNQIELVTVVATREEGAPGKKLGEDAADGPDIQSRPKVRLEDHFGRAKGVRTKAVGGGLLASTLSCKSRLNEPLTQCILVGRLP